LAKDKRQEEEEENPEESAAYGVLFPRLAIIKYSKNSQE